ncbi:MAG: histidine kinase [Bacteroidota bacterium]|nr:histidine kinase [Bacteroidota bacterium]
MAAISPEFTAIVMSTIFLLIVATGIVVLVLVYQKKQLQYLGEREQLKVTFDKEILESKLDIQEQTFKNISQEIHDNIGQILSLAKITVNTIDCKEDDSLQEKTTACAELIGKAINDLRNLSRSLNADSILAMGLIKSIEYELGLIKNTGKFDTTLMLEGTPYTLSQKQELVLFRIFQEAINNIIKHSKASEINMNITYNSANFIMHIYDNGIGFNTSAASEKASSSSGIRNIRSRAGVIGANCKINSEEGKGTRVIITLPDK